MSGDEQDFSSLSMLDLFLMEVATQCDTLLERLEAIQSTPPGVEDWEVLVRGAHSLKGAALMVDAKLIGGVSRTLEEAMRACEKGELTLSNDDLAFLSELVSEIKSFSATDDASLNAWEDEHGPSLESRHKQLREIANLGELETVEPVENNAGTYESFEAPSVPSEPQSPEDYSNYSMLELFRQEVENQLEELNQRLLDLEHRVATTEDWDALMRAAHSVKGAARMVEANAIVRVAHALEDCFIGGQRGLLGLGKEDVDFLLSLVDMIKDISDADELSARNWESEHAEELQHVEERIALLMQQGVEQTPDETIKAQPAEKTSQLDPDQALASPISNKDQISERALRVTPERLNRILGLAGEILVEGHRFSHQMQGLAHIKQQQNLLVNEMQRIKKMLTDAKASEQLLSHFERAQDLSKDLHSAMTSQFTDLQTFERKTNSLSDRMHYEVLASRMRPFSDITQGLPRLVRDMGRNLNKEVRISISGLSTLVDRDVLERIDTPLKHLVQNAVDHGIESPDLRREQGKSPVGELRLQISQSAGMLFVVLSDDGSGIDIDQLRERIISKKLATAEELQYLDEMELLDFLFVPGFSTRSEVSKYSGRGVGMDIVKEAVTSLRGSIHAATELGAGTRFQMLLPLTVSVIRVLHTRIGGESYAFPLGRIHRLMRMSGEELEKLSERGEMIIEGQRAHLIHANRLFNCPLPSNLDEEVSVVVIGEQAPYQALVVEQVLGEQEVALQRLDHIFGKVADINAAAILEDGSLTYVVDCDDLVQSVEALRRGGDQVRPLVGELVERAVVRKRRVLIADDSVTARELQRNLLIKHGFDADVVADGITAWEALQENFYDLLITDIDMPRLDGFDLVERIRADDKNKELSVFLLSQVDPRTFNKPLPADGRTIYLNKDDFNRKRFLSVIDKLVAWRTE